jgi:hypothetical protein
VEWVAVGSGAAAQAVADWEGGGRGAGGEVAGARGGAAKAGVGTAEGGVAGAE